ncbi:siderophore-interacting protein [Stackebrandtia soli]|uniref:siderophore-interacting protein n=1 Tax=Stackebrandtia soli TaxID=1892856 RepID=UPI0039EAEC2E
MSNQTRKPSGVIELTVARTERLTPHMIRVVLTGPGLDDFRDNGFTDRYVKLLFAPPGVEYPEPFCLDDIQRDRPRDQWPVRRTYTVRRFDRVLDEMHIDFVHHGDAGIAGPWAAAAKPGDVLRMLGPGGAYAPREDADWHLLVGDESAIPAIGAALERMPDDSIVKVIIQVDNEDEEQKLSGCPHADFTWLYRDDAETSNPRDELVDAVRLVEFPPGVGHFFVHGEAETVMKRIRPILIKERGIDKSQLSLSGYWRLGDTDEAFRSWKAKEKATAVNGG